jgi:hypothetical protein
MRSIKNMPHLGKMPGLERLDMPTDDFEHKERAALLVWTAIFFALAIASLAGMQAVQAHQAASLPFLLLAVLFATLGAVTLLSRVVRTGP